MNPKKQSFYFRLALLVLAYFCTPVSLLAAMMLTLNGQITTVTSDRVGIQTPNAIYFLKKEMISPVEQSQLEHLGKKTSFHIPPEAIAFVKPLEPKPNSANATSHH